MAVCIPTLTLAIFQTVKHKTSYSNFLSVLYPKFYVTKTMSSPSSAVEKSSCVFCNIINKLDNTEILYEDEDVCVFRDIKPASDYHILTVPKRHIEDAKCLQPADKELVERMLSVAKEMLQKNNLSLEDARFGYHWPPFRSVRHLHLHTIAPQSKMGLIGRMIFKENSYWFVSPEYVVSRI
ncbi:adenosine 5'-monophosphoramidase HINT3-like [Nymphalis io]|uniref:adenosine 5'-monophosphoramidase HINT3-like n=1 Tax=Inachis io TaxID=171585 RepID=UPI00216720A1|nr:adenosine 5'-monophosphoramidase HINT3-like [Nymphalis io]